MATLLVVDDDPDTCDLLSAVLSARGHEVVVEHDGEAALATLERSPIDLLVVDWLMPRLGGLEVCLAVRVHERLNRLPVIMITAKAEPTDLREGYVAGVTDYVIKPLSPPDVVARVEAALAAATY